MNSRPLTIIGCKKKVTNRVSWFDWLILFSDSEVAWIKESQGQWTLFFFENPSEETRSFDPFALNIGDIFSYQGKKFVLKKIHLGQIEFQNGESLLQSQEGDASPVYEAEQALEENSDGSPFILNIEYSNGKEDPPVISRGRNIEFAEIKAQNLRSLDSGSRIQKIICPSCSGKFIVRYKSFSFRAVCNSCFNIIDISSDDHMSLRQFDLKYKFDPVIAIGSTGKILGDVFEVIGCVRLIDQEHADYETTKYLLFSPTKSYRWLNSEHGLWTFSRVVSDLPKPLGIQPVDYRGQKYTYDHASKLKLVFALGEFFWPLQKDEVFENKHFISPPYELSFEQNINDPRIYLGRYLNPDQVTSAFKLVKTLEKPADSVPHEVSPFHHIRKEFLLINIVFVVVCFFIQLRNVQIPATPVHHSRFHFTTDAEDKSQSTEPFELRGGPSALAILLISPSTTKIKFETSLIEIRSKNKFVFPMQINGGQTLVPHIPSGLYLLNFTKSKNEDVMFDVVATYGAKSWSNFFLAVIAMSLPSIFVFVSDQIFEVRRRRIRELKKGQN